MGQRTAPPMGWRPTFADEIPDMPMVCGAADHPSSAHKHAGVGKAWFYKPAPDAPPNRFRVRVDGEWTTDDREAPL